MQTNVRNVLFLAALAMPAAVSGQTAPTGGTSAPPVQIVLYPAPEPRPALEYQLLPPFMERRPGNAAVWWNRLPAEQMRFLISVYAKDGAWERIYKWMEIPLDDPREKAYREKELAKDVDIIRPSQLFSDMDRAARFESCDWEEPVREGRYLEMLIPEIQQSRNFARLLSAKAHLEIAEGKYDEAVRTLQTGYAQSRQVAQSPVVVSGLVGLTIANIMSNEVRQLVQRPDAPNLYWALSTLPRPLIDLRPGCEAESNLLYLQFPELRNLDQKTLSPADWRRLLDEVVRETIRLRSLQSPATTASKSSSATGAGAITSLVQKGYPRAKRYLIEHGYAEADVAAMPAAQAVLLYSVKVYNELSDDQFKWSFLPAVEALPARAASRDANAAGREVIPLAETFAGTNRWLPTWAGTNSEWQIATLRICEALRQHAANHSGKWPDHLSEITEVPIPTNPFDGKPFIYERHGDKAVLKSESRLQNWSPNYSWRYEITLMQKPASKK